MSTQERVRARTKPQPFDGIEPTGPDTGVSTLANGAVATTPADVDQMTVPIVVVGVAGKRPEETEGESESDSRTWSPGHPMMTGSGPLTTTGTAGAPPIETDPSDAPARAGCALTSWFAPASVNFSSERAAPDSPSG
jgi:hypothetical protein